MLIKMRSGRTPYHKTSFSNHKTPLSVSQIPENIANSRLLSGLSQDEASEVVGCASQKHWPSGTWVFRQGEPATHLFLLESGRMKLFQSGMRGDVVVRFYRPGQVFGNGALVRKCTRISSVLSVASSRGLSWSNETICQLMRAYPRLSENVLAMLVARLFQLQDQFIHLAGENVDARLARTLTHLALTIGKKSGRATIIGDGFSAKDLADISGTTIFTVSRVLGEWERRGLLKKGRGWVMILDLDGLLQASAKRDAQTPDVAPPGAEG
jgi:CRP-like cAMP-binding protein